MPRSTSLLLPLLVFASSCAAADPTTISAQDLAARYSLGAAATLSFPSNVYSPSQAVSYIQSQWQLAKGKVENGQDDLAFVATPATGQFRKREPDEASSSTSTTKGSTSTVRVSPAPASSTTASGSSLSTPAVLQVTYPAGSYSHQTGGAEFYSQPLGSSTTYTTMLLTYDVAFSENFNWVKGGKLPGLRGGPDRIGCSGGSQPDGSDCFSVRLMWRPQGQGEVYAYIPTPNDLCSQSGIICNSDYGVSIQRGSFTLSPGTWQTISILVQLNSPPSSADGFIKVYVNNQLALTQGGLTLRTTENITSVGGLFFSTFFGGSDASWATPTQQETYYRNVQLWGGSPNNSNTTGGTGSTGGAARIAKENGWYSFFELATMVLGITLLCSCVI